jgi:hypothetical protein
MTHLGYVAYLAMVVDLFASPIWVAWLVRGWRRGRFWTALGQALAVVAGCSVLLYVVMRYGP